MPSPDYVPLLLSVMLIFFVHVVKHLSLYLISSEASIDQLFFYSTYVLYRQSRISATLRQSRISATFRQSRISATLRQSRISASTSVVSHSSVQLSLPSVTQQECIHLYSLGTVSATIPRPSYAISDGSRRDASVLAGRC